MARKGTIFAILAPHHLSPKFRHNWIYYQIRYQSNKTISKIWSIFGRYQAKQIIFSSEKKMNKKYKWISDMGTNGRNDPLDSVNPGGGVKSLQPSLQGEKLKVLYHLLRI